MLSIPLQQLARAYAYSPERFSAEEKAALCEIFPKAEEIKEKYNPHISDPIKAPAFFNAEAFDASPMRYARLWLSMLKKCPGVYVDAFLCQTDGYWFPGTYNWVIPDKMADSEPFGLQHPAQTHDLRMKLQNWVGTARHYPIFSALFQIGFYVWLVLIAAGLLICKKRFRHLLPFCLLAGLWVTTLASPVHCEYRYIYGLIVAAPVCAAMAWSVPGRQAA